VAQLKLWLVNIGLCAIVAGSYSMYAMTFRRIGTVKVDSLSSAVRFVWNVGTDRYFMGGLAMALCGSVLRIVIMRWLGIARTALVSELNLVFTVIFAWLFFDSKLRFPNDYFGALLIMLGSWFVSRE
jgi:hypothetical protein